MALTAIALLFLSGAAYGAGADISFRLTGGATWARYFQLRGEVGIPEYYFQHNARVGPAAGWGYEIAFPFSQSMTSLISAEYIQKGSLLDLYDYSDERLSSTSYKLEALSLTQLIKIKPFPGLFPYALAGFELSHILSHSNVISPSNLKTGLMDDTRKIDFGLVAGAGGELAAGRWASFIEARYHLGLVNLSKGIDLEMTESYPTLKTRAIMLLVGLRYTLGKKAS